MTGILGYGSYVPRYRIERSTIADQYGDHARGGETAVPAHDEDVTTMAVEAASTALDHTDVEPGDLDAVYVATTSDPFDERGVAPHVAYAIGAPESVRVADFQGSARAATNAVRSAVDALAADADTALVVASDALAAEPGSSAERTAGAGAGAVVLGGTASGGRDPVAALVGTTSATTGFVGRFTPADGATREGDARFNREQYLAAVTDAVDALDASTFDRAAFPAPDGDWGRKAAGALELDADRASTFDAVGYAAAGGVLLDLAATLDAAGDGERVLLAGYGPGGCDALCLERRGDSVPEPTTDDLLTTGEHVPYGKHRQYRGGVA
jgi:3-hydroxy-3-methylglutaryl CoA synthase